MKRIFAVLFSVLFLFVAACGDYTEDDLNGQKDEDPFSEVEEDPFETGYGVDSGETAQPAKTATVDVLKVGMECDWAPFNWTQNDDSDGAVKIANASGYANGYDVQIAKKIAKALGARLEIYAYDWADLIPAVTRKDIDCIIAGMIPTEERSEVIDFTSSYYTYNVVVVTRKDSAYASARTVSDLAGARITSIGGTVFDDIITQIPNVSKTDSYSYNEMLEDLLNGSIDGYVEEEPFAIMDCKLNGSITYTAFVNNSNGFSCNVDDFTYAVGVGKGSKLKNSINGILNTISDSERASIFKKMSELAKDYYYIY
ncbi:MAG: transporter substrate-binding domain-containing protein [Clostridia bacterium]|nr:transporter substrate-binding domain-containing protein [Clostridia bacterium]